MSTINIALLQMASHGTDQDANLEKGEAFCRRAGALGADVALFPEMWNIGYSFYDPDKPETRAAWESRAVGPDDAFVQHFKALAGELNMAIALTYLERWDGPPRNTVSIIDRHGAIVLTYAKVHTCDFGVESGCTRGDDFYVSALDTAQGEVQVGAMICYDREFPESARILMLKGAELILTPNACGVELNRIAQFRTRAYENMVGMAMANYAAPQENGHSVAFDGIAFDDKGTRDMLVVEAGEREGIFIARFDIDALRDYRAREIWGNAYRRPGLYHSLVETGVAGPFARADARR
ncbi:MAG: carbon-nitrogen hydrolase family protein [Anaerolineae bacterium]|nr:carbon-nitrogen hydrolase family protein [Anaerolineae bacterium]